MSSEELNEEIINLYRAGYTYNEIANSLKDEDLLKRLNEYTISKIMISLRKNGSLTKKDEEIRAKNLPIRVAQREEGKNIAQYIPKALEYLGKGYSEKDTEYFIEVYYKLSTREARGVLEIIKKGREN